MSSASKQSDVVIDIGKWRITTDAHNYILQRQVVSRGKVYFTADGYYSRIEDLLSALLDKRLRDADAKTLKKLQSEVKAARKEILSYAEMIKEFR